MGDYPEFNLMVQDLWHSELQDAFDAARLQEALDYAHNLLRKTMKPARRKQDWSPREMP